MLTSKKLGQFNSLVTNVPIEDTRKDAEAYLEELLKLQAAIGKN